MAFLGVSPEIINAILILRYRSTIDWRLSLAFPCLRSLARKANQGIGVLDGRGPGPNESLIALA
jgi:hypothetical protein